jgi:16S rRNA (uracil1498-N3)-methyltransferase
MPRFFLSSAQIHDSHAVLSGREFHHLRHVLRLNIGDHVTLCDERGREHQGTIVSLAPTQAEIAIVTSSPPTVGSFSLTLAQAILKGRKMDLVIEKATELGVNRIIPFSSAFTVARLAPERQAQRLERWQRLAQSAAKQSGSPVPLLSPPLPFHELLNSIPNGVGKILFYEKESTLTLKAVAHGQPVFSSVWVIVGPEGGFAIEEVAQARTASIYVVGLGTQTLRAETASIVAIALCRFLWGQDQTPPLPAQ